MMKDHSSGDLMAAILSLQEATAAGFARTDARLESMDFKVEGLRRDISRRFDSVDDRFDRLTGRVQAIEQRLDHPAR